MGTLLVATYLCPLRDRRAEHSRRGRLHVRPVGPLPCQRLPAAAGLRNTGIAIAAEIDLEIVTRRCEVVREASRRRRSLASKSPQQGDLS